MDIISFKEYMKKTESIYALERQIRDEKLAQGINGLEWLVIQTLPTERKKESLKQALELYAVMRLNFKELLKDVFVMEADTFYEKYETNWYICVDESLTYLSLLRERNYNEYFRLVQSIYQKTI